MSTWISTPAREGVVTDAAAVVSIFDHGFTVGDGLFETIRTSNGVAEFLPLHLDRLERSAAALGLSSPSRAHIVSGVTEVLRLDSDVATGRLRITLTSGSGKPGALRGEGWSLVITHSAFTPSSHEVRLTVSDFRRDALSPLAGHKSTSYALEVLAVNDAVKHGFDDAILLNHHNEVVETSSANIFAVLNNVVVTPSVTTGCLPGVIREVILEEFPSSLKMAQIPFTTSELLSAQEVFVTSSLRGIVPVAAIGDHVFPSERPLTSRLQLELSSILKVGSHE